MSDRLEQILNADAPRIHQDDLTAEDWVGLVAEAVGHCEPHLEHFPGMVLKGWIERKGFSAERRETSPNVQVDNQLPLPETFKYTELLHWGGNITRQEKRFDPPPTLEELRLLVSDKGDLVLLSTTCTWVIRYDWANRNREVKYEKLLAYRTILATPDSIKEWRPERFAFDAKVNFFPRMNRILRRSAQELQNMEKPLTALAESWREVAKLENRLSCAPRSRSVAI
jgi:hypothetical protein